MVVFSALHIYHYICINTTVETRYLELGYLELGYLELGYLELPAISNYFLFPLAQINPGYLKI